MLPALMRSGFQGASGRGQNHHGRMQTKEIDVPNELVGSIIGRHGLKINEIRYLDRTCFTSDYVAKLQYYAPAVTTSISSSYCSRKNWIEIILLVAKWIHSVRHWTVVL